MDDSNRSVLGALARAMLWPGALGLLVGAMLLLALPQRPDGDATALTRFMGQYGDGAVHGVRQAFWWNGAGALFAWGALARALPAWRRLLARRDLATVGRACLWAGVLLAWGGWAWGQSRGWQGELFLEPGVPAPLGQERRPVVTFDRFLLPPAPDGAGRALALRLRVDGVAHDLAEAHPYEAGSWTIRPRWYGATVTAPALAAPLFFGGDSTQEASLRDGGKATITVDVEGLTVTSVPSLPGLAGHHHAIALATFAPGKPLLRVGLLLAAAGGASVVAAHGRRWEPGRPGRGKREQGSEGSSSVRLSGASLSGSGDHRDARQP